MDLKRYLTGKGFDVSRKETLKLDNCKHVFVEPDNLYSLRDFAKFESLDFIYSKNIINETKFHNILIKEWLNFCKVGGYIIIELEDNEILNIKELKKECELLSQDKAKIVEDEEFIVLKKVKKMLVKNDSIDKWTFGIVVDGRRDEIVDQIIDSIAALKIPKFEIILCGEKYQGKRKDKVKYLKFDRDLSAHITMKKNVICKNAKYENIVVIHDRFIFDKNWYKGMKKYGNYFEVLGCITQTPKGERVDDWITFGMKEDKLKIGNLGLLDYRDWDINGFTAGGLYILKKKVWKECKWDNKLIWGQAEDKVLSKCFRERGYVERFNPFSKTITPTERGKWARFKLNKKRYITLKDRPFKNKVKRYIKVLCRKYVLRH